MDDQLESSPPSATRSSADIGRVIGIDGPAGSGKSTISKLVAERAGLAMLDTGAMYRAVTCAVLDSGLDPADADAATRVATDAEIAMEHGSVTLDGVDVTTEIRTARVADSVSVVAAHPGVRQRLVELQRQWMVTHGGGVVEGRDIGTVVFPDAPLKVFLTARPEVRAARRAGEGVLDLATAANNIAERDRIDSTRDASPLREAEDSVTIDTSDLTIDEVVDLIVEAAALRGLLGDEPGQERATDEDR